MDSKSLQAKIAKLMALIPAQKRAEAEMLLKEEETKESFQESPVVVRMRNLQKHLSFLQEKMKADLKESMEHLESTARQKVTEAVSSKMSAMFSYLKNSPLWNNTNSQIGLVTENLANLESELQQKLQQPGADLVEVGVEMGLKIEKAMESIKQIEQNIEQLRMNNAEWDPEIDPKLQNLFDSLKLSGISRIAAQALTHSASTGIQARVLKAINETQKSCMLQPIPESKEVAVVMPGISMGFKVECDLQFYRNFAVTVLKDFGTLVTGGINENQDLTTDTYLLTLDEASYTVQRSTLANAPYAHSNSTLLPYNNEIVISVAGDSNGNRASWYNGATNKWTAFPNMTHQRGPSSVAVVGGFTLYVLGGDINSTTVDFLKLKEQKVDYTIKLTNQGGWQSAQTNLDGQIYFGRRVGPPESKKFLFFGNYWWYNYDFGASYNYTGWGGSQQMGISPETLSVRNILTQENEKKEASQIYLSNPHSSATIFQSAINPCSISQISVNMLEE